MGRGAYLAATRGGTDRAAARSFSDRAQSSYSSQRNNQTGQSNSGPGRSGSGYSTKVVSDGMTQQDIDQIQAQNKAANDAAYQASLKKQADMRKAIDMAYKDDQSTSNFQNLNNEQKQFLIDSGFAAAESEGVLGGTFGAELVSNQIKQQIQNATTQEELDEAFASMDRLTGSTNITDKMGEMGLLSFDPSAVFSFGDVESNPKLYQAYQDMASKNLTPQQYTNYMNKISAFGHQGMPSGMGGRGGGFNYGYGSGGGDGGGGGGIIIPPGMQGQPRQRAQVGPGNLQEQVNQAFLSGGKPFAKGGIVSLVEN
tara:strand:- start:37 stop:972 length:936 start_codon:yes stop_codon:yes gene_type:complete